MNEHQHVSDWGWQWRHLNDIIDELLAGEEPRARQFYKEAVSERFREILSPLLLDLTAYRRVLDLVGVRSAGGSAMEVLAAMAELSPSRVETHLAGLSRTDRERLVTELKRLPWPEHVSSRDITAVRLLALVSGARVLHQALASASLATHQTVMADTAPMTLDQTTELLVVAALARTKAYTAELLPEALRQTALQTEPPDYRAVTLPLLAELDFTGLPSVDDVRSIVDEAERRIVSRVDSVDAHFGRVHDDHSRHEEHVQRLVRRVDVLSGDLADLRAEQARQPADDKVLAALQGLALQVEQFKTVVARHSPPTFEREAEIIPLRQVVGGTALPPVTTVQPVLPTLVSVPTGTSTVDQPAVRTSTRRQLTTADRWTFNIVIYSLVAIALVASGLGIAYSSYSPTHPGIGFDAWFKDTMTKLNKQLSAPPKANTEKATAPSSSGSPTAVPTPSASATKPAAPSAATILAAKEAAWAIDLKGHGNLVGKTCFMPLDVEFLKTDRIPLSWYRPHLCAVGHLTPRLFDSFVGTVTAESHRLARANSPKYWSMICMPASSRVWEINFWYRFYNVPTAQTSKLLRLC